jgi:hypothetical protein
MLDLKDLDKDQLDAVDHCFASDATFLIAGMGSGKTVIALTAIEELIAQGHCERVLVLAPLKVVNKTWRGEHLRWSHLGELRVQVLSDEPDREIDLTAHVVVVNFDLLPWFAESIRNHWQYFDGLVIDESTKLKAGGAFFKAIRKHVKGFTWRLVMTGTPVSENWVQLFYQMFLVDGGETFGRNRQRWLEQYFYPTDYKRYKWALKPGQQPRLAGMIEPFTHVMPDYRDSLPPLRVHHVECPLPPSAWQAYREMAGKLETQGVLAANAATKTMKLTQIANGFIYDEDKTAIRLHNVKLDELEKVFENRGKMAVGNILIIYQFVAELEQLVERYPDLVVMDRAGEHLDAWNRGEISRLAMHAKSGGHGLNMESGGHTMVWLSAPWSRDLLDQTIARLWRRNQQHAVDVFILVAPDTIDQIILDRLDQKGGFMPELLAHLAEVNAQDCT